MNNDRFVEIAKSIATDYKTLYIMGCFGAPMNEANKKRNMYSNICGSIIHDSPNVETTQMSINW